MLVPTLISGTHSSSRWTLHVDITSYQISKTRLKNTRLLIYGRLYYDELAGHLMEQSIVKTLVLFDASEDISGPHQGLGH